MIREGERADFALLQMNGKYYYRDCDIPCLCVSNEWGIQITDPVLEDGEKPRKSGNNRVCLITNTIPMCLRYEPYDKDESSLINSIIMDCSWFDWHDDIPGGRDYDTRCPKIAWGIAAYIGYHCYIKDGEFDWDCGTIEDIYKAYHDEAILPLRLMNKAYERAYRHKDISTMQNVGKEIEEQHRKQEEAYIEQSSELGRLLGTPFLNAAKGYITWLQGRDKPQPLQDGAEPLHELKELLPKKLRSDEAVSIFQKAIQEGLIERVNNNLHWKDTKQLLAYFADKMSHKYSLSNKIDQKGNTTTNWKVFETIFNEQDLKTAKQNWMRLNTRFEPTGFEKVDALM